MQNVIFSPAPIQCSSLSVWNIMFSLWRVPFNLYIQLYQVVSNLFTAQNTGQFLIRVLASEEEKAQALLLIIKELLRDDPIIRALEFDSVSERSLTDWIKEYLDQNITFGCFTREGNILVAVDCLYVRNIHDTFPMLTKEWGEPFRNFIKYVRVIERRIRYLRGQKKCNYLTSFGVFTSPDYRDIGIPSEMIRMRSWIARTLRIEVIGSAFIGPEMQEAAKSHRYKDLQTFNGPEDMADVGLDFDFGNIFPIKIMAIVYRY